MRIRRLQVMLAALAAPVLAILVAAVVSGCDPAPQPAQQTPRSVSISVGSYNLNNLPFFVADAQGYFRDAGLDVRTENFAGGGSTVLQALVSGSTDVAVGSFDHSILMQAKGQSIQAFVMLARNVGLVLAGTERSTFDPQQPQSIRGMRIGVTAPGSTSDFFVRYFLTRHGIAQEDVSVVGVGSAASAVAALEQGKVDLLVNYDPAATLIEARGSGRILIDARGEAGAAQVFGGPYPTSVLLARRSFLEQNPDIAQRIAGAQLRALRYIARTPATEIAAALPDRYVSGDRALYARAIENVKPIYSQTGRFEHSDLTTPLAVMRLFDPVVAAARVDLEKTYTNHFVDAALADEPRKP
ncbi:MAG TPA: ABC transporter substrate-binding protein [Stenotrophomonas sp.]|nr:ABC transporter substrate-binding protein [Stenotrophomonas sp.]